MNNRAADPMPDGLRPKMNHIAQLGFTNCSRKICQQESLKSPSVGGLRGGSWRLATEVLAQTKKSESFLPAVERVQAVGPGKPAQLVPLRFIYTNKLEQLERRGPRHPHPEASRGGIREVAVVICEPGLSWFGVLQIVSQLSKKSNPTPRRNAVIESSADNNNFLFW